MIDFGKVYAEKMRLREVESPKKYDSLPPTFITKTINPLNFIPVRFVKHFNERLYSNYLHRECFNACIDSENDNQCYLNCQNKHLTAIELFKVAVEEQRKWDPISSFINLREYQKRPSELGQNIVSDSNYSLKHKELQSKFKDGITHNTHALDEIFSGDKVKEVPNTNLFNLYLNAKFPQLIQLAVDRTKQSWGYVAEKDYAETD